jgi:hypothetical protein
MEPLLQHRLQGKDDGLRAWRIIVATLLLKQTKSDAARRVADEVFRRWPHPDMLANADEGTLRDVLRGCGMQDRRTRELREVSRRYGYWLEDSIGEPTYSTFHGPPPKLVRTWHGCGQYVEDAVRILVHHEFTGDPPSDKQLRRWWDHQQQQQQTAVGG